MCTENSDSDVLERYFQRRCAETLHDVSAPASVEERDLRVQGIQATMVIPDAQQGRSTVDVPRCGQTQPYSLSAFQFREQ